MAPATRPLQRTGRLAGRRRVVGVDKRPYVTARDAVEAGGGTPLASTPGIAGYGTLVNMSVLPMPVSAMAVVRPSTHTG
jgi:hypothetical protein